MKILSCHINNFGTLTNYRYEFNEGINTFCNENGKGKTTLANFIKAMLYGLPTKRDNQKDFSDREHYYPFNGGVFGGSLTIEKDNKIYIIEREFDKKSTNKDTLNIYDEKRNKLDLNIINSLGEYFFEIDEESFKRTAFIYANDITVSNTDSISKKLNNLIDNTAEKVPFEKLMKNIDNYCKSLLRKNSKGKKGSIDLKRDQIYQLNSDIQKLEIVKKELSEKYAKRQELEKAIEELKRQKQNIDNQKQKQAYIEKYKESSEEIKIMQEEVNKIDKKYPNGILTKEDLINLKSLSENEQRLSFELKQNKNELDEIKIIDDKKFKEEVFLIQDNNEQLNDCEKIIKLIQKNDIEEYQYLKERFNNEIPTDDSITLIRDKIAQRKKLEYQLSTLNNSNDSRYDDLSLKFKDIDMSSINLNDVENKINHYNLLLKRRDEYYLEVDSHKKNKSFILGICGLILGGLLTILGGVVTSFNPQIGIPFIIEGVGLFIIAMIVFFKSKKNKDTKTNYKIDFNSLKKEIDQEKVELNEFFNKFNIISEDYKNSLNTLKLNYKEYQELADKIKEKANIAERLKQDIQALDKDIKEFILRYQLNEENIDSQLNKLQNSITKYTFLEKEYLQYEDAISKATILRKEIDDFFNKYNLNKEENISDQINKIINAFNQIEQYNKKIKEKEIKLQENSNQIEGILSKYHLEMTQPFNQQYELIEDEINHYNNLVNQIKNKQEQLNKYKQEKDLEHVKDIDITQSEEIEEKLEEYSKELFSLNSEIDKNEKDVSKIVEKQNDIIQLEKIIEEENDKYCSLEMIKEYFIQAEKNLKDTYIGPLEQTFKKYLIKINNGISDNSIMDFDFDVKYDINGYTRSNKHLSDGQKTCLMLSLRLAMIENMYKKETPFIILDDALMALDENNFKRAVRVIKEVAKTTQIIYFCCHQSRVID